MKKQIHVQKNTTRKWKDVGVKKDQEISEGWSSMKKIMKVENA